VQENLPGGLHAIIRVPPSPETLRAVAQTTGAEFFTAPNDTRLREVYERLASHLGRKKESREISDYFAAGSAALLLAGAALSAVWFRRVV
jgi:Ca-activated chloride channel family protein